MKITIANGKQFEIFEDIGAGALTVFDGWVKSKLDAVRAVAGAVKNKSAEIENTKDAVAGMRIIADHIASADILDLSWDEWFSVFACQSEPVMSIADYNRWTNAQEIDDCKKKLLQAVNPSSRLELHLKRLGIYETVYSMTETPLKRPS